MLTKLDRFAVLCITLGVGEEWKERIIKTNIKK